VGFKASGHVSGDDYDKVLTPAIDKAIEKYERIKLLAHIGPGLDGYDGYDGYSLEAAWDDTKLSLAGV
jgi:hypothetical protein